MMGRKADRDRRAVRRLGATTALLVSTPASAASFESLGTQDGLLVAVALGACAAAAATGIAYIVRNRALREAERRTARLLAAARADLHAVKALVAGDADGGIIWTAEETPHLFGSAIARGVRVEGQEIDVSPWLGTAAAAALATPLARLRSTGEGFVLTVPAASGRLRLEGRAAAGSRVLAARALPAEPSNASVAAVGGAALFAAAPWPAWVRDAAGDLAAVNPAFAAAVAAKSPDEAVTRGLELLDQTTRDAGVLARRGGGAFRGRTRVVSGGQRRVLDVFEIRMSTGAAGLAVDVTAEDGLRREIERTVAAHRRTLDQLATAVVMFGPDERLMFHNAAYEALFALDAAFLDARPTESEILEHLRTQRRVPEQADFRAWREHLREAYRAVEPVHDWWHLPGGQMLRMVATPNAEGGVTYLFEDVSERMALESRYNTLIRIQGETLDGLAEAVAVFGSDGRLRLYNQAFLALWSLGSQALGEKPHIDAVAAMCRPLHGETRAWARIRSVVTALDHRRGETLRLERADGRVLDGAAQPLPDGGTMVTFRDITDSVKVERALVERNEALEAADALKNAFVGHVSYHLRTPLNTLIGYAHMLAEPGIGPLTARQQEFLSHVRQSSDTLRALIDDILDLATIDAGAMGLDLRELDVGETLAAVADAVRDLLAEAGVRLVIAAPGDVGRFVADGRRVRQILFNLISNAVAVSPKGGAVTISAQRRPDALVLTVQDEGPGIASDVAETLFQRFEARPSPRGRAGVGLGLSIVRSFMELHGGSVSLASAEGGGTLAVCVFPLDVPSRREAAA
ncbi:PAS/PAC sensor signal transduction histidine kinase /histidine kinase [Aquabacter spiritensis]|uniref:histidine kinase n=2 Tax=Aquabacter spiritensis TaxID=933073 RepID=A0A4R3M8T1_9HYPH|nr:PAS/PAC sensor signal transduction histidine kinase /histidine kinase [Aquabacter spiritensis]